MTVFSNLYRAEIIDKLKSNTFDMLVIGGGITGAGIALDAASRGLKVALVEKNDFASGTSSKSTKLIHGGLRYLKQFDFWLVKEVGTERAIVHQLAPHLVVPEKMLLPIIKNGTYGSWLTSFGLKIYDVLASVEGEDKRRMLHKREALELEPLLPQDILEGAGYYAEYRTDDARLTIEVLKTAAQHSAKAINYTAVEHFIYQDERITGASVIDEISKEKFEIHAKCIVNATGPWVDKIRAIDTIQQVQSKKRLHLTKGIHLVFPFEKLPVKQSVYFDVPDGRMIFAIPRGKITYVGTTDTNYLSDINKVTVNQVDALYIISAINHMFTSIEVKMEDILSSWAGLRPLIHEKRKSPSELSRKDEIFESDSGLLSIAGGKLTGYRKMSERITDLVCKRLKRDFDVKSKPIQTEHLQLVGGDFKNYSEVKVFTNKIYNQLKQDGFQKKDAQILVHKYGTQCNLILQKYFSLNNNNDCDIKLAKAELWFCLHYEMVQRPLDFFTRRTGKLFFEIETIEKLKIPILKEFQNHFEWSDQTFALEMELLHQEVKKCTEFETN